MGVARVVADYATITKENGLMAGAFIAISVAINALAVASISCRTLLPLGTMGYGAMTAWQMKRKEWKQSYRVEEDKMKKKLTKEIEKKHARNFGMKSCIVLDWFENGIRRLILNIRGSHFAQYLGIPLEHPLAGFGYEEIPLECHGGLTFGEEGDGKNYPKGFYWYGWDYAHSGDYSYYGKKTAEKFPQRNDEKDWTLKEVVDDGNFAFYNFEELIKLAEKISGKKKGRR